MRHENGAGKLSVGFGAGSVAVNRGTLADAIVAATLVEHGGGSGGGGSVEIVYGRPLHSVDFTVGNHGYCSACYAIKLMSNPRCLS